MEEIQELETNNEKGNEANQMEIQIKKQENNEDNENKENKEFHNNEMEIINSKPRKKGKRAQPAQEKKREYNNRYRERQEMKKLMSETMNEFYDKFKELRMPEQKNAPGPVEKVKDKKLPPEQPKIKHDIKFVEPKKPANDIKTKLFGINRRRVSRLNF